MGIIHSSKSIVLDIVRPSFLTDHYVYYYKHIKNHIKIDTFALRYSLHNNITCEYLSGTCYIYQKCLFYFTSESCECKKYIKLIRISKPECDQQIYSCAFILNN